MNFDRMKLEGTWFLKSQPTGREFRIEVFRYEKHGSFGYSLYERQRDGSFGALRSSGQSGGGPQKSVEESLATAEQNINSLPLLGPQ